jgi:hypothetical protein
MSSQISVSWAWFSMLTKDMPRLARKRQLSGFVPRLSFRDSYQRPRCKKRREWKIGGDDLNIEQFVRWFVLWSFSILWSLSRGISEVLGPLSIVQYRNLSFVNILSCLFLPAPQGRRSNLMRHITQVRSHTVIEPFRLPHPEISSHPPDQESDKPPYRPNSSERSLQMPEMQNLIHSTILSCFMATRFDRNWSLSDQQTRIKWFGPNESLFYWSGAEIWSCVRKRKSGIMAVFTV